MRSRRRGTSLRTRLELTLLLGPALGLFVGFVLVPIGAAAYYSLHEWSGFGPLGEVVGLQNYREALSDEDFQGAIVNNLVIVGLSVALQLPLGLGIALLLDRRFRGRRLVRLMVFAPFVLSEATTAVIWLLMLQPDGFVDQAFEAAGLGGLIQLWLADTDLVLYTLFVVVTWKYIGLAIVLFLAGLRGIQPEVREAAALDGATGWQSTRYVTLPLLAPTIRIWIFLSVIGSLQLFDIIWIITGGGPANASATMATYLIDDGFEAYRFGYGSAVAVILFAICFVFAVLYQRFALRRDTAGAVTRAVG